MYTDASDNENSTNSAPGVAEMLDELPDVLTPSQVARLYGASVAAVSRWAEAGRLPSWKTPGGHRRFSKIDVADALERGYSALLKPTDKRFL